MARYRLRSQSRIKGIKRVDVHVALHPRLERLIQDTIRESTFIQDGILYRPSRSMVLAEMAADKVGYDFPLEDRTIMTRKKKAS